MEKDIEVRARTSVLRRLRSSPRHERVRLYTNHNRPALRANAYLQVWAETERGAVVAVEARLTLEREKRIEELRAEIAEHERHRGDGYDLSLPAGKRGLSRYHRFYRRNLDVREGVALALAEALAELSALEQREPTIEERFPIGSRWKMAPASVVRVVSRSDFERGAEERADQLPDGPKVFVFYEQSTSFKGGYSWDDGNELSAWTRLDDTPPAQPVDRDVTPENVSKPVAVGDVLRVVGRHTFFDVGDDWIVCELGVDPQGAHMRQRSDGPRASVWCPASLFPKVFGFVLSKKPAPPCEYRDALGREHPVDADEYLVCRVCRASDSDRRRERRRRFDAWPVDVTQFPAVRGEPRFGARSVSDEWDVYGELMPTRELAIAALFEKMERAR